MKKPAPTESPLRDLCPDELIDYVSGPVDFRTRQDVALEILRRFEEQPIEEEDRLWALLRYVALDKESPT